MSGLEAIICSKETFFRFSTPSKEFSAPASFIHSPMSDFEPSTFVRSDPPEICRTFGLSLTSFSRSCTSFSFFSRYARYCLDFAIASGVPITSAVSSTVRFKSVKFWNSTCTEGIPASVAFATCSELEASSTSGLVADSSSIFTSVPFTGALTFSISGYTRLNHSSDFTFWVVETSLGAPPSRSTTWLFACHKSAIRSGLVGTVTSLPSISLMTLVPSPLSFTKKLVCSFDPFEDPEMLLEVLAEEAELLSAAPEHPVKTANNKDVVSARDALNFVTFIGSSFR